MRMQIKLSSFLCKQPFFRVKAELVLAFFLCFLDEVNKYIYINLTLELWCDII